MLECKEKKRLMDIYSAASDQLSEFIGKLSAKTPLERAHDMVKLAALREGCIEARLAYQCHRREHQC